MSRKLQSSSVKPKKKRVCKLEEEARRVAEEARRMAEENKWTDNAEPTEDSSDYHVTTSNMLARQKTKAIGKSKVAVAVVDAKSSASEEGTNTLNQKLIVKHAQQYVAVRAENVRLPLQQGFQKPAQAVNRDVVIGETITVGELANNMRLKALRSSKR